MGDVVGDLAHGGHQTLDLVEHAVEIGGELVELIARTVERNAVRQVSGHDALAGPVHLLDTPQQIAAHRRTTQKTDRRERPIRPTAR